MKFLWSWLVLAASACGAFAQDIKVAEQPPIIKIESKAKTDVKPEPKRVDPGADAPRIPPTMLPLAPDEVPLTDAEKTALSRKHAITTPVPSGKVAIHDPTDGGRYVVDATDAATIKLLQDLVAARIAGKAPKTVLVENPATAIGVGIGQGAFNSPLTAPCPNGRCPAPR